MKITKRFLKHLINEAKGKSKDSCPKPTQDAALNKKNKARAADSKKIKYGMPGEIPELKKMADAKRLCGNCAAYDISASMVKCGGANKKGTIGYCKMHDFSCTAKATCLTHAQGGPIK